ncbi:MAG TPA: response regulator, partial [Candidatus Manganitrophaceae bacterium]|nr:response regulator [Candidatus Manganitrophaceae bacterium]
MVEFTLGLLREDRMPKQILIVDDDEDSLFILSAILAQAGFDVVTAKDGQEALRILCRSRPDLVVLDLILPEMDGFSVSETIKSSASLRAIPVLMISAWTDADSV